MAIEFGEPLGQVRLLIADTSDPLILPDEAIQGLLGLNGDVVKLAAADALDAIATSEALLSKKITKPDVSTDGPAVAKALRDHAKTLREQAATEAAALVEDDSFFEIIGGGSRRPEGSEWRH